MKGGHDPRKSLAAPVFDGEAFHAEAGCDDLAGPKKLVGDVRDDGLGDAAAKGAVGGARAAVVDGGLDAGEEAVEGDVIDGEDAGGEGVGGLDAAPGAVEDDRDAGGLGHFDDVGRHALRVGIDHAAEADVEDTVVLLEECLHFRGEALAAHFVALAEVGDHCLGRPIRRPSKQPLIKGIFDRDLIGEKAGEAAVAERPPLFLDVRAAVAEDALPNQRPVRELVREPVPPSAARLAERNVRVGPGRVDQARHGAQELDLPARLDGPKDRVYALDVEDDLVGLESGDGFGLVAEDLLLQGFGFRDESEDGSEAGPAAADLTDDLAYLGGVQQFKKRWILGEEIVGNFPGEGLELRGHAAAYVMAVSGEFGAQCEEGLHVATAAQGHQEDSHGLQGGEGLRIGASGEVEPGEDGGAIGPGLMLVAAVDEGGVRGAGEFAPGVEGLEEFGVKGGTGFDFDGEEAASVVDQNVNLHPLVVPPKIEAAGRPIVEADFSELGDGLVFEKRTSKRRPAQGFSVANAQQMRGETRVHEVQLRHLHQALVEVAMMGLQPEDHKTRFQHGNPSLRGFVVNSCLRGECGDVQQLTDAASAQPHKPLELDEVRDAANQANIAFDVGPDVVGEPIMMGDGLVEQWRITSFQHGGVAVGFPVHADFREVKWHQLLISDATSERL